MELVQLAKQGDGRAIATLLNRAFEKQATAVKVNLRGNCLQVLLEATPTPEPLAAMTLMQQVMSHIQPESLERVQVYGREIGAKTFSWQKEIRLQQPQQPPSIQPTLQDRELTKQGDFEQNESQTSPCLQQPSATKKGKLVFYSTRRQSPSRSSTQHQPQAVTVEGWGAVLTGLGLAVILFILSPLKLLFRGFLVMVHEVGHALAHWLFGRPAIPMIDFAFGGGITLSFEQSWLILGLIYVAIAYSIWLYRVYPRLQGVLVGLAGLYSFCLLTDWNLILSTFMGHGMEVLAIFICLYLSISGYFRRMDGDRTIYAMLGFFTLFSDLQFSWQLLYDLDFQSWYEEGKGGIIDNDLVILASEYFNVDLSTVVGWLVASCITAPILAFLLFRYESWLRSAIGKLLA
ncbi:MULTISPECIES: hypothetical protein [Trichocoleus]|uniref:Uncharacterized protein n=1 Tax=Trichocoleus desertorum GB2-A4 TaxID=2933944 RepID=A0ABV0JBC6_9CYAN|nr:hypothetical protein [Trichocoleus sp. FACHB-46]MBD1864780.1 hypothetical protein [Trichocoleus sp. FACHB-46]